MTRSLTLTLGLALALAAPGPQRGWAQAQMGGAGVDCQGLAEMRFASRPLGDGGYLYQLTITNPSPTASLRYSYSFAVPDSRRTAEALNGYLTPGGASEHALGSGPRNLGPDALRRETILRCFPL